MKGGAPASADPTLSDEVIGRVQRRLVDRGEAPHPQALAAALRAESPVLISDAEMLRLIRQLQRELVGRRTAGRTARRPVDHRRGGELAGRCPGRPRARAGSRHRVRFADEAAVQRLARRLATAAGQRLDDAHPARGRPAHRRHAGCMRSWPRSPRRAPACRCGCCDRSGTIWPPWSMPGACPDPPYPCVTAVLHAPVGVSGLRRNRFGQDDPAVRAARRRPAARATGDGRGCRGTAAAASARGAAGRPAGQCRGGGDDLDAGPGAAGAADAAGPAGGRRGAGRGGGGPAGRDEHRP